MSYSLGQAAKALGVSKATMHRYVQSGKVSAAKDEASGRLQIDPAELDRLRSTVSLKQPQDGALSQSETSTETALLRVQLEKEREERLRERAQLEGTIDDLRRRLDSEGEERRRLTALLTDKRAKSPDSIVTPPPLSEDQPAEAPAPTKRRWRLFGGRG
jgi:DNA-binding transcriptional MerR regulator